MHPAEAIWHTWKNHTMFREVVHTYPAYAYMMDTRVVAESAVIVAHLSQRLGRAYTFNNMDVLNKLALLGNNLLAYREGKHIYQITRELTRELSKLRTTLRLPMRELRLPRRGCVLDFTEHLGPDHPQAIVFLSYDMETSGDLQVGLDNQATEFTTQDSILRIQVVTYPTGKQDPKLVMSIPAELKGRSIWDAVKGDLESRKASMEQGLRAIQQREWAQVCGTLQTQFGEDWATKALADVEALRTMKRDEPMIQLARQWRAEIMHYERDLAMTEEEFLAANPVLPLVVNTLLYLQGDPDVVKAVHPGQRPTRKPKQAPNLQKLARKLDHLAPTVQRIGERFTAAIKLYEIERAKMKAEHEARGTKCPHLRAPHPHVYRIGEGRLDVLVKFLGWIGVKGAEVPKVLREAYAPVITPVK